MTQRHSNQPGREHRGKVASDLPAVTPAIRTEELGELLDQVRDHAALVASDPAVTPAVRTEELGELLNQVRDHAALVAGDPAVTPAVRTDELGELLDQVRDHTAQFVSEVPRLPRTLRVRAGEVSVDVEWPQEHVTAPGGAEPAVTSPVAPVAEPVTEADPKAHYLTSPTVGVFYPALEPGAAPFVSEGDTVVVGQQVGIIEAMKLMIPIEADMVGRVVAVLKNSGEPVEYGERLFAFAAVGAG